MRRLIAILFLATTLSSCSSTTNTHFPDERKYVSYVLKLPSPDGKQALYSYWVEYPEAHSGQTRFAILPATVKFAPSAHFFAFVDTLYGYNIEEWIGDTVKSVCITASEEPPQVLLPYKRQVAKVANTYWVQDYYAANLFGAVISKYFDSVLYTRDLVIFVGKDTVSGDAETFRIAAKKGQVTVPLGDTIIRVNKLEAITTINAKFNNGDTVRRPPLVSLASYQLQPKRGLDWKRLKDFGVFVEQRYNK